MSSSEDVKKLYREIVLEDKGKGKADKVKKPHKPTEFDLQMHFDSRNVVQHKLNALHRLHFLRQNLLEKPNLVVLDLSRCNLGSENDNMHLLVSALRDDKKVHTLKLTRSNLDAKALRKVGHLLEYNGCMHYNGSPITFKEIAQQGLDMEHDITLGHGALTSLDFRYNTGLSPGDGRDVLCHSILANANLTELNGICVDHCTHANLEESFGGIRTYELALIAQRMYFSSHDLDKIDSTTTLTSLNLSKCKLAGGFPFEYYEGIESFSEGLAHNSTISYLDLSENSLFARGAELVAAALATNEGITHLDFSDNDIGPLGAAAFKRVIGGSNTVLRFLDLTFNNIRNVIKDDLKDHSHAHEVKLVLYKPSDADGANNDWQTKIDGLWVPGRTA
jgi:hypothetical protein